MLFDTSNLKKIMQGNIVQRNELVDRPRTFFKYHRINDHLFELLKEGKFWFSRQEDLNDPYDCRYSLSDEFFLNLNRNVSSQLLNDLQAKVPHFNNIDCDRLLKSMLPILKNDEWINGFYNMLFKEGLGWCVCCFTTDPMNELMWAHYADSNRGVCLEFDLSLTSELQEKIFPVEYNNEFPIIDSIEDLPEALLRKRVAWKYEKEWRILTNVPGSKMFSKASLSTIYFGCNISEEKINEIRSLMIAYGYTKVDFKQFNFYINNVRYKPIDGFPFT